MSAAPAKEVGFLDVCRRVAVSTEALLVVSAARAPRHLLLRQIADAAVAVRRVLTMEMVRPGRRSPALVTSVCAKRHKQFPVCNSALASVPKPKIHMKLQLKDCFAIYRHLASYRRSL